MTQQPGRHRTWRRATSKTTAKLTRSMLALTVVAMATALYSGGASAQQALVSNVMSYAPLQLQPDRYVTDDASGSVEARLSERLLRTEVMLETREAPGTVIIDTAGTHLYYVLGGNRAIRYGVGVGREGFTWVGAEKVTRKAEWPDWRPPAAMIARQPYLPRFMAGGPGNPLGARAMYLGTSQYRIHGTNDASTIGKFVSSGCIRLTNADVEDLFNRVQIGAKVVVLSKSESRLFASHTSELSRTHRGELTALR